MRRIRCWMTVPRNSIIERNAARSCSSSSTALLSASAISTCAWTDQVLAPGNELVATVNTHRDALTDSIGLLNIRDVTLQPAASLSNPAQLVDIVRALRETTDAVIWRTRALAEEAQKRRRCGASRRSPGSPPNS